LFAEEISRFHEEKRKIELLCDFLKSRHSPIKEGNQNFVSWCLCGKNHPKQAKRVKIKQSPKKLCVIKTVIPATYKKD
jgi:hypothetical protein